MKDPQIAAVERAARAAFRERKQGEAQAWSVWQILAVRVLIAILIVSGIAIVI